MSRPTRNVSDRSTCRRPSARSARSLAAALVAVSLLAAACGSDDDASSPDSEPRATDAADTTEPASTTAAFPVTIEHKYGATTIDSEPQRIAVVGLIEQDALLALGVVPVATTEWFGGYPGSLWPWASEQLESIGGEVPASLGDVVEPNFESVAAQDPDVIIAVYSGLTDTEYATLNAIAPTVAQPAEYIDFGVPWDVLTRTVAAVVGKSAEAEQLIADVEAKFATAREEHPEFVGASGAVATPYDGIFVYGPEDVRGRFMTSLGFVLPDDLGELAGDEFGAEMSPEQAEYVDLDLVVWLDAEEVMGTPVTAVYDSLAVHTEAREVFMSSDGTDVLGGAMSFVTVLSLPFLIDGVVPLMATAIDGDPATVVER